MVYKSHRHGFKVTLNWSYPFVHIVKYAIWGSFGKVGWVKVRQ